MWFGSYSSPTVSNSIFRDNGDGIEGGDGSGFTCNLIDLPDLSGWPASNSNAAPMFADMMNPAGLDDIWGTADDGLRLLPGSPGIDAGDDTAVPAGVGTDLVGNPRVQGVAVDLGPYEYCPAATGVFRVAFRLADDGSSALSSGGDMARVLEFEVASGGMCPEISVVPAPGLLFVRWVSTLGEESLADPLVLVPVEAAQTWAAIVAPARPNADGTVFVKAGGLGDGSSWAAATGDLQDAVEACALNGGGEVWVAGGVYRPDSRPNGGAEADARTVHFSLRNGVAVRGGFPADATDGRADCDEVGDADSRVNRVVLSGDIGNADTDTDGDSVPDDPGGDSGDNAYHVLYHPEPAALRPHAAMHGVWIVAGFAGDGDEDHQDGGGMYNGISSPTLSDCVFTGNRATDGGGMYNYRSSPSLANCLYQANLATDSGGGMHNSDWSWPSLSDCVFHGNVADLRGGGIYKSSYSLLNCVFMANRAREGGGAYSRGSSSFSNCAFQGNYGDYGGAIHSWDAPLLLSNCVFQGNRATYRGGAIYAPDAVFEPSSYLTVSNSVFRDNGDEIICSDVTGDRSGFSHNLIDLPDLSGWPSSNSNADPLFADEADPDGRDNIWGTADDGLHLLPGSPGIDAGDDTDVPASLDVDLLGNQRIQGEAVDQGPYEYRPAGTDSFRVAFRLADDGSSALASGDARGRVLEFEVHAGGACPGVSVETAPGQHFLHWVSALGTESLDGTLLIDAVAADQTWTAIVAPARPNADGTAFVKAGGLGDGSSWGAAMGDLQAAIEACALNGGGEVWVAAGVYWPGSRPNGGDESDPRTVHFSLRNGVVVRGGFPADASDGRADSDEASDAAPGANRVVLSGDIGVADTDTDGDGVPDDPGGDSGDNTHHVFHHPGWARLERSASLCGVSVVAGLADGPGTDHRRGGGMRNDFSSPSISHCVFAMNRSSSSAGGMLNLGSSPAVSNCVFTGNQATSSGGGTLNVDGEPSFSNCVFVENEGSKGGGMYCYMISFPTLSGCVFLRNRASEGGGMYCYEKYYGSLPVLSNSIFWDNGDGIVGGDKSKFTHNLLDVADLSDWPASNSNADPQFADVSDPDGPDDIWGTADDGLRLLLGSPGIDAGDNAAVPPGLDTDLAGNARIQGGTVDLGPYECLVPAGGALPSVPAGPGIADGAVSVPETERLSWAAASFATEYAVYLWVPGAPGRADLTRPPGALPVGRTVACSYAPQTGLEHSTAYAWQVVARNANGETEGPVWTFTTWSEPPETPADGVPADGDLAVLWTQRQFGWSSCERAVSYNVYLWQAGGNRPGTAAATVAESRWLLGAERVGESTLVPEMGYCWQVIARSADSEREGPVWSFRTEANAPATFGVVGEYDGVAEAFAVVCSNWHDPEGAGEELRYEWRRNGVPVPGLDQPDVSLAEVAGQRGDAGLVSCRVTAWDGWEEGQVTEWGWAFYEFEPGWNVVALPLVVENADPAVLFTDPVARGPLFQGPTWDWNGDTLRYEVAETLEFGRGYWVFVPERREAATSVVSGVVPEAAAFAIQNRWRLVGFPSFLRDTLAEEIQTETGAAGLQEWRANGYHVSSGVLDFLRGYWIFLNQAAVLQPAAR
ncbi:MAG: hypothetical protein HN380_19875 [Victivallales bacterium]|nr:hypothetical protein [Victivallales bacterium]